MTLTVGSLFSGIGGIDLGLERAGHKVIWQSEIDLYACKVLQKHWPKVTNHGDIKKIDWATVERPDIICGGYPCQPFSTAGKRQGAADPRHLWPWVRQAISEIRPRYAMLENVRGHLSMGATTVIGELAEIGYDAEWRIISAAGVGAPHRRDRIIIVAYPTQLFSNGSDNYARNSQRPKTVSELRNGGRSQIVANANSAPKQHKQVWQVSQPNFERCSWWATEPDVGRVANGVPNRVDRLKGLGNAVVPQVAELVGRLIGEHAKQLK